MSKANDVEDLLGETTPAKKTKAKAAPAKEAAPAAKKTASKKSTIDVLAEQTVAKKATAKKAAVKEEAPAKAPKAKAEPKERVAKEPVTFAEGERDEIIKRIKANCKKPINSKDLAAKLGIDTRKLRPCLYTAQKRGIVDLEPGASPVAGMTVSLAAAA